MGEDGYLCLRCGRTEDDDKIVPEFVEALKHVVLLVQEQWHAVGHVVVESFFGFKFCCDNPV